MQVHYCAIEPIGANRANSCVCRIDARKWEISEARRSRIVHGAE
ncbi:hypothetical protein BURPS1106B_A2478 [Burkholderia pseudomallei 1106b]|uniref:Uncharacterized protein n=1 Tax=Burkholderia pseudomallei (strain 1106a) TaxID=357348 RepID=A3NYT0_BURP0|nr:hypothetical protein BURPS1106A_3264 [Burkholderia pseudomallei 1106a]EES26592.1 hypothetical protein BURPS1106B_A2478 [Burkholderia pseudomallei 1106b]